VGKSSTLGGERTYMERGVASGFSRTKRRGCAVEKENTRGGLDKETLRLGRTKGRVFSVGPRREPEKKEKERSNTRN